ncbi:MAG: UbiD family decarboxylase, partial [Deltaproteobacteria bacterium]|nr:UbiD family decarboxylase [Deltaproteobacteria bacterium]
MAFDNLQSLLAPLEKAGELTRIREPLSPRLEITEVSDRVVKAGGPALLFERPRGFKIPVLTNLYGSMERVRTLFGIQELDDLGARIRQLLDLEPP